jgi:hypothetical protein
MPKTRKGKSKQKVRPLTVPQLRKAFEHIEAHVVKSGYDTDAFRKEWKKTFGKDVSEEAAKDYLMFVKSTGKQSGGGLQGAPLDYVTRAGADPSTAAQVPPYVQSGFFIPEKSFGAGSGVTESIGPKLPLPADVGSNLVSKGGARKTRKGKKVQKGGALFPSLSTAVSEFMSRPFLANSPPNVLNDLQYASKGQASELSSPRPEINPLKYTQAPSDTIYGTTITKHIV